MSHDTGTTHDNANLMLSGGVVMRRKLCAVVLLISVSLSMFACSKGKGLSSREPEYITEDSLWFGSSRYELESGFDGWGSGLATYGGLIYADSEQLRICFTGTILTTKSISWSCTIPKVMPR